MEYLIWVLLTVIAQSVGFYLFVFFRQRKLSDAEKKANKIRKEIDYLLGTYYNKPNKTAKIFKFKALKK